ncbi:HNH endonuclease signature motif containing protein [Kutzneria buriramensis]|nr:HNH endonuclease signature motif containing protein [Kutzneria buriramensis]
MQVGILRGMELTRELERVEPCGALLDLLAGLDLDALSADERVTVTILARKIRAFADYVELAVLRGVEDTAELAMAITEPEQTVVRRKELTEDLRTLPRLMDQLREGRLDLRRLEAVRDRVRNLPSVALIAEVEDALLDIAPGLTHSQLGRRTTALVAQADPTGYEQRHQKAKSERRVEIRPLPDGMAHLTATLPAVEARMVHDLLCADAKDLPKDDRTTDQKRADAFLDRFLGNVRKRDVQVHVTISMETLMGLTEDPALLEGYGPITADTARELAMDGIWRAILLDDHDHADTIGKHTYRPGRRLKELVGVRAGNVCSAPGCTRPIQEGDHVTPWPKGHTTLANVKGLCTRHHHLKHDTHKVTVDNDGSLHWTTPHGRNYTTTPHKY